MRFASVRDLRSSPRTVLGDPATGEEIVLTSNGRPVALVVPVRGDDLEAELGAFRQARAQLAIERMRTAAKAAGLDAMGADQIDGVIAEVRRKRARRR